jgi:hypothetical protein
MTNVSGDSYGGKDIVMPTMRSRDAPGRKTLACELPEELLLVHVVLEGFAAIDEYDRHFVIELAPKFEVVVDVNFVPCESSAAGEFVKTLLHHFAKVAPFAGIYDDVTRLRHAGRILARAQPVFQK